MRTAGRLLLLFVSLQALAAPRNAVDPLIRRLMQAGEVPGLSIVVIENGKAAWEQSYGVADDSIFEAASLSKPVFAYAVLKLADAGVIQLDAPLHQYLEDPSADERMKRITARMVLSHTTGFQNEVMPGQTLAVHFTPGTRFSYSGAGFLYLQRVVEHVTGKDLAALMQELVFHPLGMHDSGYVWTTGHETRQVYGHSPVGVVAERRKPTVATVATLHTTPRDYARFIVALMNGELQAMFTPQTPINENCFICLANTPDRMSKSLTWGLGIALERTTRGTMFFHWGDNNSEIHNFAMGSRDTGDGVVIFTTSGNGLSIIPEIVSAVLPGPHPSFAWMGYESYDSPAKVALRAIRARGAANASASLRKLTEGQINRIGYALLGLRRIDDAILVFEYNVRRFPASANTYDSLGEAYAAAGIRDKAVANYQRSLALDPNNSNAAEWLRKLSP